MTLRYRCLVRARATVLPFGLTALVATACGSSSQDSKPDCYDSGLPPVPEVASMSEQEFITAYVKSYCDALQGCCQAAQFAFDRSNCEANVGSAFANDQADPATSYDPDQGASCIGEMQWFGTVCPMWSTAALFAVQIVCAGVYHGTTQPGKPCTARSECAAPAGTTTLCLPDSTATKICQTFADDRHEGESCTRDSEVGAENHGCVGGFTCDENSGKCVKECDRGPGASCDLYHSCGEGEICKSGHCVELLKAGATCSEDLDCRGSCTNGVCDLGLDAAACQGN